MRQPNPVLTPVFKHTKTGNHYEILIDNATCERTGMRLVIYRSLSNNRIWSRSYEEFFGPALIDGVEQPRFQRITY